MARPNKEGLDYFPLDTDMDTDDKIVLIEGRYGIEGYGTVVKLLSKIYKEGYYYPWTEKELLLFSQRTRIEEPFIKKVVDDCLKWDIFNKKLYKKYQILTSNGIQKRYFEAVKRRLKINVCKEYTLNGVLDNINDDNVNIYSINDDINTQRKEEKRKEQHLEYVMLLPEEHKKLLDKFGKQGTNDFIVRLNNYIGQIGLKKASARYDSHYHTILNWSRKDIEKQGDGGTDIYEQI
jgi:hypothetical protein